MTKLSPHRIEARDRRAAAVHAQSDATTHVRHRRSPKRCGVMNGAMTIWTLCYRTTPVCSTQINDTGDLCEPLERAERRVENLFDRYTGKLWPHVLCVARRLIVESRP